MSRPQSQPQPLSHVAQLPRYVPGARGAADAAPPIKLSSNENPLPPLPSVVEAITRAASAINRYPDMFATEVTERIATGAGVASGRVVVGGGSVAVLAHLLQAFAGPGDNVVYAWRSFEAYPILTRALGATPIEVPLGAGFRHDLAGMSAAVTDRTKVLIVCSPNNPTGSVLRVDEFEALMADVPPHVLVVLDEAYLEFVTALDAVRGADVLGRWPNLVVVRTFSKAYGLAGLRVGYAIGEEDLMGAVRACVTPFSVSGLAQAAALASLDAEAELLQRVQDIVAERERVVAVLAAGGWELPEAQGNFFWLPVAERATELASTLGTPARPILVRPFAGDGVRVTIGAAAENDALLAALAHWQLPG